MTSASQTTHATRHLRNVVAATILVLGVAGASVLSLSSVASALTTDTLYVSSSGTASTVCAQGSPCQTIQDAITYGQNTYGSNDDVVIDIAAGSYTETDTIDASGLDSLSLQGAGVATTTINGNQDGTVITIDAGDVSVTGLTVTGGTGSYTPPGSDDNTCAAGILVNSGATASLSNDAISDNSTPFGIGGGVLNVGTASLTDDTVSNDNADFGGGVTNEGTITMNDDTVSNDSAHENISGNDFGEGGGIGNVGTAILTDDTVSNDTTGDGGGGIYDYNGASLSVVDSTLSNDTSVPSGNGNAVDLYGPSALIDDTVSNDAAPGDITEATAAIADLGVATMTDDTLSNAGIWDVEGSLALTGSILDNGGCSFEDGTLTDGGGNVESDDSCGLGPTSVVNSPNIDLAGSLAANGPAGPDTLAFTSPTSSAVDAVPAGLCQSTVSLPTGGSFALDQDEQGNPRPGISGQSNCDAGAFELQASGQAPTVTSASTTTFTPGEPGSFTVTTTGFPTPHLTESGALPTGVTFTDNGDGTATLAGTTAGGSYPITITASNGVGTAATQPFTLTVAIPGQLEITTTSLPNGTVGVHYSATLQAAGGSAPYRFWYVAGGSMPRGLHLNSLTGVLSGTPSRARTYTVIFRVRDARFKGAPAPVRAHTTLTVTIVSA